jgi:hypothetical protein
MKRPSLICSLRSIGDTIKSGKVEDSVAKLSYKFTSPRLAWLQYSDIYIVNLENNFHYSKLDYFTNHQELGNSMSTQLL